MPKATKSNRQIKLEEKLHRLEREADKLDREYERAEDEVDRLASHSAEVEEKMADIEDELADLKESNSGEALRLKQLQAAARRVRRNFGKSSISKVMSADEKLLMRHVLDLSYLQ